MSSLIPPARSPDAGYWRSLEQLQGLPDPNVGAEFHEEQLDPLDGPNRRRFLQIMGASVAMAGAVGCSKIHRNVVPAVRGVAGRTLGSVEPYATTMELAGVGYGVLAQNYEGRPIRLDGNPNHPMSLGATSPWTAASILNLYDPDRSKTVYHRPNPQTAVSERTFADFFPKETKRIYAQLVSNQGEGFRILSEDTSSPTLLAQREQLLKALPKAKWITYEPIGRDNERQGAKQAFGQPYRMHYDLSKAEVIVDLDCDLLRMHPASLHYTRQFAANRKPEETLKNKAMYNRLYCVESQLSTTGGTADHRLALRSSDIPAFVAALAGYVQKAMGTANVTVASMGHDKYDRFAEILARDLVRVKGKGVIAVGFRQPPEVHAAVHRLNHVLGNLNTTVLCFPAPEGDAPSSRQAIVELAQEMAAGKVNTLLILGGNPVYNAPADAKFAEALAKVPTSIHLGMYRDETAQLCNWHIPQAHFLEAWGDARGWDGTVSITQPTVEPLFGGKSSIQFLALFIGAAGMTNTIEDGFKLVSATFQTLVPQDTQAKWRLALQKGVVDGSAWKPATAQPAGNASLDDLPKLLVTTMAPIREGRGGSQQLEAVFVPDAKVFDGRFNNNAWLQELPDFITKITWDNAILLSQRTAERFNLRPGQVVTARIGNASVKGVIFTQPGQADNSATFLLGYGRQAAGVVGGSAVNRVQTVGFDFYPLRTSTAMDIVSQGVSLQATGETYKLATTQLHHEIDTTGVRERDKRADVLVRSDTLAHFLKEPGAIHKKVHQLPKIQLFHNPLDTQGTGEAAEYRWGMAIDLATCTGCNACVIACQSENNIPTVGKEQVINRREMHWLRIDRYFQGSADHLEDVAVVHQPMMCVHCENAPCEQVCPVGATVHSAEGTNDMVYNRCIGTRYCANNCPYKVRRFNFLNYQKQFEDGRNDVIRMVYNPDVTVRGRGVMEKCTYCIQRIRQARIKAKNAGRRIQEGEVVTACQQACPAGAITFGDLNDTQGKLWKLVSAERGYKMLEDINTRPRTSYLARIRNANPELEPAQAPGSKEGGHGHA
jgi:molybdopterin-containing oxidoreductase family iron-sulfur binding subunit